MYPETARLSGAAKFNAAGQFERSEYTVRSADGDLWYTSETLSNGDAKTTNHRNGRVETSKRPAESLSLRSPSETPDLGEMYRSLGWRSTGTTTFNGRTVNRYEVTAAAPERNQVQRSQSQGTSIQLPYLDDIAPTSFRTAVLVDPELSILLKYSRWAIGEDGREVLVESVEVLKSRVER